MDLNSRIAGWRVRLRTLKWAVPAGLMAGVLVLLGNSGSPAGSATLPTVGWSQGPSLPESFGPRWDAAYASFPPSGEVVLFGGDPVVTGDGFRNDTWVYGDGAWAPGPDAPAGMEPRGGAAMAFDPDLGKVVLFGGAGEQWPPYDDTWLFDGTSWQPGPATPPGMAGRTGAKMVYDENIHEIVLFGGSGTEGYNDTWLFDGTSWQPGPAAPVAMSARTFFAMAYDPTTQKVLVAGGDGGVDTWLFDGSTWTRGADLPADIGPVERWNLVYNPQLGGMMFFGGIGGGSQSAFWILRDGTWLSVPKDLANPAPLGRLDGGVVWMPNLDAMMMFGGEDDGGKDDSYGLTDTWYFRDVAPLVDSVSVTPTSPDKTMTLTLAAGAVSGGYRNWIYENAWFKNGAQIPGVTGVKLTPTTGGYVHGDVLQAKVRVHDGLGIYGPWVASNTVTVVNRPPLVSKATFGPSTAYDVTTLTAAPTGSDPDGDVVTYHYNWTVNGTLVAANDIPTLTPSHFKKGDVIGLTTSVTDSLGMPGNSITSTPITIKASLTAGNNSPGKPVKFTVKGFKAGEVVEIHVDSPTGLKLGQSAASSSGGYGKSFLIPAPFPGGSHPVYAVGATSGLVGPATMKVLPVGTIAPVKLAAGDATTYTGLGFKPGEQVSVSFPGGTPSVQAADATGSVTLNMVSPPEPAPGANVTATALSGKTVSAFTTSLTFTSPAEAIPQALAPITLTGFGAQETINLSFDAQPVSQTFVTDAFGSLQVNMPMNTTFGTHTISVKGVTSGITDQNSVHLQQTMTLSPTSGPAGTLVTITSGPGWMPGETLHLSFQQNGKDVVVDGTGSAVTTFKIPSPHGTGVFTFTLNSATLGLTARADFTITS